MARTRTTWTKGMKSPNPGGRPKTLSTFRDQCRDQAPAALATLEAALKEGGPVAVSAAKVLLAYAYGNPPSAQEDRDAGQPPTWGGRRIEEILTEEELINLARQPLEPEN